MTFWQSLGSYEFEVARGPDNQAYYTGWYRCVGGRLADGRWPMWNMDNSEKGYC
jgi:hypothetical protein